MASEDSKRSVAKTGEALPSVATQNFFEKYGRAAANRNFVGELLKFSKFGEYRAGKYDDEVALGTRVVAYMGSFTVGWVLWEGNRPVEQIMGPVGEGFVPPRRDTLDHLDKAQWEKFDNGELKDPWAYTSAVVMADLGGKEPKFYTFTTTSKGGIGALGTLSLQYGERLRQKPAEYPIVELNRDSYMHQNRNYGEIRVPVFTIVDWAPVKDLPPIAGMNSEQPKLADSSNNASNF
jgi:hypothetical protein